LKKQLERISTRKECFLNDLSTTCNTSIIYLSPLIIWFLFQIISLYTCEPRFDFKTLLYRIFGENLRISECLFSLYEIHHKKRKENLSPQRQSWNPMVMLCSNLTYKERRQVKKENKKYSTKNFNKFIFSQNLNII
jgi:hypothetical protein